jgi:hypothetical protein
MENVLFRNLGQGVLLAPKTWRKVFPKKLDKVTI